MRSVSYSTDTHGITYTEKLKKIERLKRVKKVEKEGRVKPVGYYEERGMTDEDKSRKTSMTPQEAFRREIAQRAKSKIYTNLQETQEDKDKNAQQIKEIDEK